MRSARFIRLVTIGTFFSVLILSATVVFRKTEEPRQQVYLNTNLQEGDKEHSWFPNCRLSVKNRSCSANINVLVTGVAGFVGSHVADKIRELSKDINIIGVDDLSAYGEVQRVNIPSHVVFIKGDLSKVEVVRNIFLNYAPIDIVYHIAAYGGQGMSNFIRRSLYTKNTMVSANLVNAAVNHNLKHFVFISSCAVYGSRAKAPLLEHKQVIPDDPYGISKYATELDIQAAKKQFNLNYTIFRAHNLYGPRQFLNDPFRNVVSIWLRQMLLGHKISVFGSGDQTRSFTYIDDISTLVAEAPFNFKARNQILNAGNEHSTKLNDMLSRMSEILKVNPVIERLPVRRETSEVNPDHGLQNEIFGVRKFTSFNIGLIHTIAWAKTLNWELYGFAAHPYPEVQYTMPASWIAMFDSGAVSLPSFEHTEKHYHKKSGEKIFVGEKKIGTHTIRNNCRFDGSPLVTVIDFGHVPLANNFLSANSTESDFKNELLYPLTVGFDPSCGSLQVNVMPVAQEGVWKDYYYFSSVISSLSREFEAYARDFSKLFTSPETSKILEIGCNDGVFLRPLAKFGFQVFGVDPASNVVKNLREDYVIYDTFFGLGLAESIAEEKGQMDAIVTSNSFAHIDDMINVMNGIKILLKRDGILAIQVHYAVSMVKKMQYDWIYHEHLSYYSLYSLTKFLSQFNFHIFDAKETSMHGGSIRVYAQDKSMNREETDSLKRLKEEEFKLRVNELQFFSDFAGKMELTRVQLTNLILGIKELNKTIIGYGAPARATTLSAYLGIDFMKYHLTAVIDDSPAKQGAFMPGTHLKIVSSHILNVESPPNYVFLFAWPWLSDVLQKNMDYVRRGGSFIVPLPEVHVINSENVLKFL